MVNSLSNTTLYCYYTVIGYVQAKSTSVKPKLHQLALIEGNGKTVRVIQSAASKWEIFATHLHFEVDDIKRIRSDYHLKCQLACLEVCMEWLAGVGRKPTNWTTLITALKEAELGEVANDLNTIVRVNSVM